MKQPKLPLSTPRSTVELAPGVVRVLAALAPVNEGAAARLAEGREADTGPIEQVGQAIVRAAAEGLLDETLNVADLVPEAIPLVEEAAQRARRRRYATTPEAVETSPAGMANDRIDEADLMWQSAVSRVKIESMLAAIARDGDPGEAEFLRRRALLIRVVGAAWSNLSNRFPAELSPDVAFIKQEFLPGVDPWLGGERDFRKAAWVCRFLAKNIEARCDLTVTEAHEKSGIPKGTISRGCQLYTKSQGERGIMNNGKARSALRMNRHAFEKWRAAYEAKRRKAEVQQATAEKEVKWASCSGCGKAYAKALGYCPGCKRKKT